MRKSFSIAVFQDKFIFDIPQKPPHTSIFFFIKKMCFFFLIVMFNLCNFMVYGNAAPVCPNSHVMVKVPKIPFAQFHLKHIILASPWCLNASSCFRPDVMQHECHQAATDVSPSHVATTHVCLVWPFGSCPQLSLALSHTHAPIP